MGDLRYCTILLWSAPVPGIAYPRFPDVELYNLLEMDGWRSADTLPTL